MSDKIKEELAFLGCIASAVLMGFFIGMGWV